MKRIDAEGADIASESLPAAERELDQKKEQRRNVEKELKALKEGKDNSQGQLETVGREIQDARNREQQAANKAKAIESEVGLKNRLLGELEQDYKSREAQRMNAERDKEQVRA